MQRVGFVLFLLGAGGMDSTNQIIPGIILLLGLITIIGTELKEKVLCIAAKSKCTRQKQKNKITIQI